ncbi:MAG: DUF1566 domain-containing protein, partial [Proteobacteria bacterium]|nr:DUF1566 domain-containing protein [Pseudomonadota bacterium]
RYGYKSSYYYVRAVRCGQSNNNFIDKGNGTITDTGTGLMWQKATAPGTYTWEQALTYCENLNLPAGGYSDWRLPNRNEMQSIVDYSRYNPAIDTTYFPGTVASDYWSSTTYASITSYAWYVSFGYGYVSNGLVNYDYVRFYGKGYDLVYVRAVRGGQCGATVIDLASFTAAAEADRVILEWTTASEIDNAGFNLYRSESEDGEYAKINGSFIPAKGSPTQGASYEYVDKNVKLWKKAYYKLEDIDLNGTSTFHGPIKTRVNRLIGE